MRNGISSDRSEITLISDLILGIRRENPPQGKAKIAVILQREHGFKMSEKVSAGVGGKIAVQDSLQ
ncbi:MAG: hypothetical protein LBF54_04040 [Holosporaceae bacterium]|nr:hypothetical protein [Holosporaceae bacterium]